MVQRSKEEIENFLGQPLLDPLPQHVLNHRRNCLITSILIISMHYFQYGISWGNSNFFSITGSSPHLIYLAIGCVHLYNWISFIFEALLHDMWLKIQATGTIIKPLNFGMFVDPVMDTASDQRQSSLMFWWKKYASLLPNILNNIDAIKLEIASTQAELDKLYKSEGKVLNAADLNKFLFGIAKKFEDYNTNLRSMIEIKEQFGRVEVSLNRFANFYMLFSISQVLKYLIWDFLVPASLGAFAACLWLGLNGYVILPTLL